MAFCLRCYWPLAVYAAFGGLFYYWLGGLLEPAIVARAQIRNMLGGVGSGPVMLFLVSSGVFGWGAVVVTEARVSIAGPALWLVAALAWLPAITLGLWAQYYSGGALSENFFVAAFASVVGAACGALKGVADYGV